MRIGVLTTSYPRWAGDPAGAFVGELARALVAAGDEVTVVAAGPGADHDALDLRIGVERVPGHGLFYGGGAPEALAQRGAAARAAAFSVQLHLAARNAFGSADALLSHWLVPSGLVAAALAGGRPHVAIGHGGDIHLLGGVLARWGSRTALGWLAARARVVVSSSAGRARLAAVYGPAAAFEVCPMGLEVSSLVGARARRAEARARLGVAPDVFVVAFLGRLVPIKGLDLLQVSLPAGATLLVAGEGPERARLEQGGGRFLGAVDAEGRLRLLAAADVLVVPSRRLSDGRTEGAPRVVLEGMAAGVPVIASDSGGIAELLGEAGLLVPAGDVPALGAALVRLRDDPALAERLGMLGAQRALAFDWTRVLERLRGWLQRDAS